MQTKPSHRRATKKLSFVLSRVTSKGICQNNLNAIWIPVRNSINREIGMQFAQSAQENPCLHIWQSQSDSFILEIVFTWVSTTCQQDSSACIFADSIWNVSSDGDLKGKIPNNLSTNLSESLWVSEEHHFAACWPSHNLRKMHSFSTTKSAWAWSTKSSLQQQDVNIGGILHEEMTFHEKKMEGLLVLSYNELNFLANPSWQELHRLILWNTRQYWAEILGHYTSSPKALLPCHCTHDWITDPSGRAEEHLLICFPNTFPSA